MMSWIEIENVALILTTAMALTLDFHGQILAKNESDWSRSLMIMNVTFWYYGEV